MSLEIGWLDEANRSGIDYYKNVVQLFNRIEVTDTPEVRKVLELIEQAQYKSPTKFIDRFGGEVYVNNLSTGCKAALALLLGKWDKPVSLVEVGNDACSVIVSFCKDNSVLLRTHVTNFVKYSESIDAVCDGEKFTDVSLLNLHISYSGR